MDFFNVLNDQALIFDDFWRWMEFFGRFFGDTEVFEQFLTDFFGGWILRGWKCLNDLA